MTETLDTKQADVVTVHLVPSFELPSIARTAESMLVEALEYCAQKIGVSDLSTVLHLLEQPDRTACEYCHYSVAKQVAASLGAMDENVKSIYLLDYDATPEDRCFGTEAPNTRLIHMLVWTVRKTAAFDSLVQALDQALVQAWADTVGAQGPASLLDVQVLDDADVERRQGYGAFLSSIHQLPIQIWER